jgi:hypothetical protein
VHAGGFWPHLLLIKLLLADCDCSHFSEQILSL